MLLSQEGQTKITDVIMRTLNETLTLIAFQSRPDREKWLRRINRKTIYQNQ